MFVFIPLGAIEIGGQPLTEREMLISERPGKIPKTNIPTKLNAL